MAGTLVGRSVPRIDALGKVTGSAEFGSDIYIKHQLYGKILRSPYAHAKILNIDVSKAKALKGVHVVLTSADIEDKYPGRFGPNVVDHRIFAKDTVLFQGDEVAAVAAETEEIAEEAVNLIEVQYDELEPLLDPYKALEPDSPILHPDLGKYKWKGAAMPEPGTNVCSHYRLRKGDVDKAFDEADYVFEGSYSTQMFQHGYLELINVWAKADPISKRIHLWGAPGFWSLRNELSECFNIPLNKIRITQPLVGAAFGGKTYASVEPIAVCLSFACNGRPVKVSVSREELFQLVVRGPAHFKLKTAVTKDFKIIARIVDSVWNTGAYAVCGPTIVRNSGHTSAGPYNIPNIRIDARCVYTNCNLGNAFRGYGVQEATWAMECHMDDIATKLGINPYELRKRNLIGYGDIGATGQIVNSTGLEACLESAWYAIKRTDKPKGDNRFKIGRGIACLHKATKAPCSDSAIVKLSEDGTATILLATREEGQGNHTVMSQMVGEVLGLDMEDIVFSMPDTEYTPFDDGIGASRATYAAGNAVLRAALDVKEQIKVIASKQLNVELEDIEYMYGRIWDKKYPEKTYNIKEFVKKQSAARREVIIGKGLFNPPGSQGDPKTGQTKVMTPFWMYGCQAAEVQVDTWTGEIKIRRIVAAHDVGTAIHPMNCRGQIEGAVLQGIGSALYEEVKLDDKGITVNPNLHDYKMPTSMDYPEIETIMIESNQHDGPFGAKGVGEPALSGIMPAIRNAVYDAIGIQFNDVPMTPEKVIAALKEKDENNIVKEETL